MKNIKQVEMGALYLDGAAQTNPAYLEAGTIPEYQSGAKISIGEIPADHSECTITWNEVRVTNGQTLLIANHTLLVDVSYDDLEAAGFVEGQKVTLDGKGYLCRLLRCDKDNHEKDEWAMALDVVGKDDGLWHWQNAASWAIAPTDTLPLASLRAFRGYFSARYYNYSSASGRRPRLGFRPVLVPLASDKSKGERHAKRSEHTLEIRVATPKGVIVVSVNDPTFPGVSVDLERSGDRIGIATIESDTDNDGAITAWLYADADSDDYTQQVVIKGID